MTVDRELPSGPTTTVVVMGVSGTGKTTVAEHLVKRLGWPFAEGDEFHPPANVAKMHAGTPLDDDDRWPWLQALADWIGAREAAGENAVVTCSALKRSYRDIIVGDRPDVRLVYLKGSHDLIRQRMAARHGHFMPSSLLDSQFSTLEEPSPDENAIVVDIGGEPEEIVGEIAKRLCAAPTP